MLRQLECTYVLDDHDEEGKLDGKSPLRVGGACHVVGGNIGAHDLDDGGLDVSICQSLDVTVSHILVPDLEGLRSEGGKTWSETGNCTYPME